MHILSIPGDHCYIHSCPDYLRRITIKKNPAHFHYRGNENNNSNKTNSQSAVGQIHGYRGPTVRWSSLPLH